MSPSEKRWYIWEYYKYHIVLGAIFAGFLGSIIYTIFINPPKDDYIYIGWNASHVNSTQLGVITDYLSVLVYDPDNEEVRLISYTHGTDPELNMAINMRMMAQFTNSNIDIFLTTYENMAQFYNDNFLFPISYLMLYLYNYEPDLALLVEELAITPDVANSPVGISMENSSILQEAQISTDGVYLVIMGNSQRRERIPAVINMLIR